MEPKSLHQHRAGGGLSLLGALDQISTGVFRLLVA